MNITDDIQSMQQYYYQALNIKLRQLGIVGNSIQVEKQWIEQQQYIYPGDIIMTLQVDETRHTVRSEHRGQFIEYFVDEDQYITCEHTIYSLQIFDINQEIEDISLNITTSDLGNNQQESNLNTNIKLIHQHLRHTQHNSIYGSLSRGDKPKYIIDHYIDPTDLNNPCGWFLVKWKGKKDSLVSWLELYSKIPELGVVYFDKHKRIN